LKTAYINLKLQGGNKFAIYRFLLERIAPELPAQGLSAEEMLRYLLRYLRENKQYALIIMDEIDYLIKTSKDTGIIYDLTRLNEFEPDKPCNVKGVVFIARSTEFYNKLDRRTRARTRRSTSAARRRPPARAPARSTTSLSAPPACAR
jgi:Cdc6-like AAA superfamily ATPase